MLAVGFDTGRADTKTFWEEFLTRTFFEISLEQMLALENYGIICLRMENYNNLSPYQISHFLAATVCQLSLCNCTVNANIFAVTCRIFIFSSAQNLLQ
jgi:hypothetical protein